MCIKDRRVVLSGPATAYHVAGRKVVEVKQLFDRVQIEFQCFN